MTSRLVIGTRGSALARRQTAWVARALVARHAQLEIEERVIATAGDLDREAPIDASGERGVFVRALEGALLAQEIDVAVHSLKDMPTEQPGGLRIAAVPPRHDPRDALLTRDGHSLAELPHGARVGTGSPRRRAQLLHVRPDLRFVALRGNVDTRVKRVADGELDAVVLALAGIERLGISSVGIAPLPVAGCLPAAGQGALAVEVREEDEATRDLVEPLHDAHAGAAALAERAFLRRLGGGCLAPATAYARVSGTRLLVDALVARLDGRILLGEREHGPLERAEEIGSRLAERLIGAGARALLDGARAGLTESGRPSGHAPA